MFQKHLKKIDRTSDYNFDRTKYLRLDRNERTISFNQKIIKNLRKKIVSSLVQSYPMGIENLENLISKREKLNNKYINIVPGSDSALKYIFEIFSEKINRSITSIYPTYGMIGVYSKIYKFKLIYSNLDLCRIIYL